MTDHLRPDTLAIHADRGVEPAPDVAPPIHMATTFSADNPEGLVYSREAQPTRSRAEAVLGALEGGVAVLYASGQAATLAALMHFAPRRVALGAGGYHATRAALDALRIEAIPLEASLATGDLVWLETPRNPTAEVLDVEEHAARAHRAGAALVVDSTFATPVLLRPLELGAELTMHSASKFLSGHSDALAGALVARDPAVAEQLLRARTVAGGVPGALETWLVLRGMRTLPLRVRRQSETAGRLAAWLAGKVERVWHPSLPGHPGYEIARRQMRGPGAVLSFELAGEEAARALPKRLRLIREATSLGGVETLIDWRRRHDPWAPPGLLRLSVGLEEFEDLAADLEQALRG
ncbi:MAG TPA: PLP-dependent transferase [Anaeromyxobacter sp.]|nr:PLP-dependent transferase [Anaeromyxobacter sp.]